MRIFGKELLLEFLDHNFERLMILTRAFLNAHHNVAVHLKEAAVAVVSKAFVFAAFGQSADGSIVESKVEDGVHHSRHGVTGP